MRQARLISACQRIFGSRGVEIGIVLLRVNWIKQLDMIIGTVCVVAVAYLSDSILAVLMLIGFGAWNYYTGLREGKELSVESTSEDPSVSPAMIRKVKQLKPGGALRYSLKKHQVEFVVIEGSDFDHIIGLAGLKEHDHEE